MHPGLPAPAGRCRRCARPFTSGEVTGLGILRPRSVEDGGPIVEFTCPTCRTVNPLVPHGAGRFAPPGVPPPPPPPPDERQVPWQRGRATPEPDPAPVEAAAPPRAATPSTPPPSIPPPSTPPNRTPPPRTPPAGTPAAGTPPAGRPAAETPTGDAPPTVAPDDGTPRTAHEALEVLGVGPHALADEIERAYRALALKLHPDKVAHLDADFVALAERKFRRLQAARDLLLGPR